MRKAICWAIGMLLLAGCAMNPNRSTMLTEDTVLITMNAAGNQSRESLYDEALNEAARVTREHGFRYFEVLGAADASEVVIKKIPGTPLSYQNTSNKFFGTTNLSSAFLPGATYTTPDQQLHLLKVALDVTIRMYRDGGVDPARQGVWNSETVLARNGK